MQKNPILLLFPFLILAPVSVFAQTPEKAESIRLTDEVTLTMEGRYERLDSGWWRLSKDAWLSVTSPEKKLDELILALRDAVLVRCGEEGILEATGIYVMEIKMEDGTRYRVPKMYPSISRRFEPDVKVPIAYSKLEPEIRGDDDWVTWWEGKFRTGGFGGVEAVYPPSSENPMMLVSMGGEVSQINLTSDLKSGVEMDGKYFEFWRSAHSVLKREKDIFRGIEVPPDRVGARAYEKHIRESLNGIDKIAKGYQMLQSNQHSAEVVRRMLEKGVPLPRLSLAEITIVRGHQAFSFRPFISWQGKGRVLADSATLVTTGVEPSSYPPYHFVVGELSGRIYKETRLLVENHDARIETRRPGTEGWETRSPDQFDLASVVTFTPRQDSFSIEEEVDATGYFQRKDLGISGIVHLGSLLAEKDRLVFHYGPESENREAAVQISNFLGVRKNLFFPDKELRVGKLRPPGSENTGEAMDFLSDALDRLVEAVDREGIGQVDRLDLEITCEAEDVRKVVSQAGDFGGKTASGHYEAEFQGSPIVQNLFEGLDRSRYATDWLDLDLGVERF